MLNIDEAGIRVMRFHLLEKRRKWRIRLCKRAWWEVGLLVNGVLVRDVRYSQREPVVCLDITNLLLIGTDDNWITHEQSMALPM